MLTWTLPPAETNSPEPATATPMVDSIDCAPACQSGAFAPVPNPADVVREAPPPTHLSGGEFDEHVLAAPRGVDVARGIQGLQPPS